MKLIGLHYSERSTGDLIGVTLESDITHLPAINKKFSIKLKIDNISSLLDVESRAAKSSRSDFKLVHTFDIPLSKKLYSFKKIDLLITSGGSDQISYQSECGIRYREGIKRKLKETYLYLLYSYMSNLIIRSVCRYVNPAIIIHCWDPAITNRIIQKFDIHSTSSRIILLKPCNIKKEWFDAVLVYAMGKNFRSVQVLSVPPVARDIGGFISALLNLLETGDGRPALLIHSKNTEFLPSCLSEDWRNSLIDPLITGMSGILALLKITFFGSALVCSKNNMRHDSPLSSGWKKLHPPQKESFNLARDLSLRIFKETYDSFTYCAGTMMWVNPNKIRDIWTRERLVAFQGLLEPSENLTEPSHAHAFERLFPEALRRHGKKVSTV